MTQELAIQTYGQENYVDLETLRAKTRNDGWWATILFAAVAWGPEPVLSSNLPPIRFADAIILIMFLARWWKSKQLYGGFAWNYRSRLVTAILTIFTVHCMLSLAINTMMGTIPFFFKDWYIPIVFFRLLMIALIAASFHFEEKQIRQLFKGLIFFSILAIFIGLGQKYNVMGVGGLMERLYPIQRSQVDTMGREMVHVRVTGTFSNPNCFGGHLVMLAVIMLGFAIHSRGLNRVIAGIIFGLLAITILFTTGSRTSLIGLAAVSTGMVFLSIRRSSWVPALLIFMLFGAGYFFLRTHIRDLPINPRVRDVITGEGVTTGDSFAARQKMWARSMEWASQSWIFGVGPSKSFQQETDNGYIYTLLRLGIFGLGIFVTLLLSFLIRGFLAIRWVDTPWSRALLLGLIMIVVNQMIFEIAGEFFWNIRYGAIFGMFIGLLSGFAQQLRFEPAGGEELALESEEYSEEEEIKDDDVRC